MNYSDGEFFAICPHSTTQEAAKALNIPNQKVRNIVEGLRICGEDIKFNNIPKPLEMIETQKKITEIKLASPSVTNRELSIQLGVPISLIRRAIFETTKMWQSEHAESIDFYTKKVLTDLEDIEQETWNRTMASKSSSSRWLELNLMAKEKKINILGIKAPEKININKDIKINKSDRDKVVEGFMATDVTDVDFTRIEVTGELAHE